MSILITTGYNFEGYRITEYLGIYSGECAIGTGFLSSIDSELADFFGERSSRYENKLINARNRSIEEMERNAQKNGANGVIGLDIKYTVFSNDVIGVMVTGTAVRMEPISGRGSNLDEKVYDNTVFNPNSRIKPLSVTLIPCEKKIGLRIRCHSYLNGKPDILKVDFKFITYFDEVMDFKNVIYTEMEDVSSKEFVTEINYLEIENMPIKLIKDVQIFTNQYLYENMVYSNNSEYTKMDISKKLNGLRLQYGRDVVQEYKENDNSWECVCGHYNANLADSCEFCGRKKSALKSGNVSAKELISIFSELKSAREMLNYIEICKEENSGEISQELVNIVNKKVALEKAYGNMKESCLKELRKYFDKSE